MDEDPFEKQILLNYVSQVRVSTVKSQDLDELEEWIKEKPVPYTSHDKFSQEDIFQYWSGSLSGHDHVNQTYPNVFRMWRQFHGCPVLENNMTLSRKKLGTDPGNHIEVINQYEVADL